MRIGRSSRSVLRLRSTGWERAEVVMQAAMQGRQAVSKDAVRTILPRSSLPIRKVDTLDPGFG